MLTETNKKKILLLTLVHPDFLPPVYAIAQVLRDLKFDIHILTFDSLVPATIDLGDHIKMESAGKHHDAGTTERIKLRNKFTKRAMQLAGTETLAVISFCPFSLHTGIKIKSAYKIPLIYHALEIADFRLSVFLKSPLSNYRNLRALQTISKADLVATPSIQRSAWLAGRCHLSIMPYTILNTAYLDKKNNASRYDVFREMVPAHFLDKKIILYTGAVNTDTCVLELVRAFELVNDEESVLIINGVKDDAYGAEITVAVSECTSKKRILLLPYLTRDKIMALQAYAHIGASLIRDAGNNVKSNMPAPNKVGEYMARDLFILGILNDYLRPLEMLGVATLSLSPEPVDISSAIKKALAVIDDQLYKARIKNFVGTFFCMQQQLKPVINYLNHIKGPE